MVLKKALEGLFRLFVFDSGFFFLLFLCLDFISVECLFLFTQLGQSTGHTQTDRKLNRLVTESMAGNYCRIYMLLNLNIAVQYYKYL